MLSLDLPLALLSTSVKTLTFSRKKDSPLTYSCQFIFIWMAYITGSFVIFHVHKLLPCLSIVTSKYDIWDWLTCTVVGGGRNVRTVTWLRKFLASISYHIFLPMVLLCAQELHYCVLSHDVMAAVFVSKKQWNCDHICVSNQSCVSWTLFLCKRFLLFQ